MYMFKNCTVMMAKIESVKITNFKNIRDEIIFCKFMQHNTLAGLFGTVKKDFIKAIFFGLGASKKQLAITQYSELRNSQTNNMSVKLTLVYNGRVDTMERRYDNSDNQFFFLNNANAIEDDYYNHLKELQFDLSKQMLFCDSANVQLIVNMLEMQSATWIGAVLGMEKSITAAIDCHRIFDELNESHVYLKKDIRRLTIDGLLGGELPDQPDEHAQEFADYTILMLNQYETERSRLKDQLVNVQREINALNTYSGLKETIRAETENREQKITEKQSMIEQMGQLLDGTNGENYALLIGIRKLKCEWSLRQVRQQISGAEKFIAACEQLKIEAEWNIEFMTRASGTTRKCDMIPRDNLLKLYPLYHWKEELEMDKMELKLMKKKAELAKTRNEQEIFDFMEVVLPLRKRKQVPAETIEQILSACNSAMKGIFNPKTFVPPKDALKVDKLRSLIPSKMGFLLNGTFRANQSRHQKLIDNILADYKYTVVLFRDNQQSIYDKLKVEYTEWYQNVTFLVLNQLSRPSNGRVLPQQHWLNYCTFIHQHIEKESLQTLMHYMGEQLDIRIVESGDEVKDEYRRETKKYVASIDGRLIYAKCSFGFDVLKYIRPATTDKDQTIHEAHQHLEEALRKLTEFTSTFVEMEETPREPLRESLVPLMDYRIKMSQLNRSVALLEQAFAVEQQLKDNRMEALHQRLNKTYEASHVQDYTDALDAERKRLDEINGRITTAQNEMRLLTARNVSLADEIDTLARSDDLKAKIDTIEEDIVRHNKVIKESEQRLELLICLQSKSENLRKAIRSLKYQTIHTVLRAQQANIDLSTIGCNTTPPTLWQDIRDGVYIDPMTMSTSIVDMADMVPSHISSGRWYPVRDLCNAKVTPLKQEIATVSKQLEQLKDRLDRLRDVIVGPLTDFLMRFNMALNEINREIHPNSDTVFEFSHNLDDILNNKPTTFTITNNGEALGFEDLSKEHKMSIGWLVFAALNDLSQASFAFICLEEMDDASVNSIDPIIQRMARKIQLFIDSSSTLYSHMAKVQYGVNVIADAEDANLHEIQVVRHDASQSVSNVDQRDDNFSQHDLNVDQLDGNSNQRDLNVDQRDDNSSQRDGN